MKCEHDWKIFRDPALVGKGELSFYCRKCLAMEKRKIDYKEE